MKRLPWIAMTLVMVHTVRHDRRPSSAEKNDLLAAQPEMAARLLKDWQQ